jgi:hypothetical protein
VLLILSAATWLTAVDKSSPRRPGAANGRGTEVPGRNQGMETPRARKLSLRSERRFSMARILVVSDEKQDRILLDEYVHPSHIEDEHASLQILERLAWAIKDASAIKDTPQTERLALGN